MALKKVIKPLRSEAEIRAKLEETTKEYDEYGREPAQIFSNAPRALMQVEMEVKERILKWVCGEGI